PQPGDRRLDPNKSTYVTRGGGTSRWPPQLEVHFKGTEAVPTRRMNVADPRALRRALRREAGFAKITKRVRRAVSMAAGAVGVRHHGKKAVRRKWQSRLRRVDRSGGVVRCVTALPLLLHLCRGRARR